MGDETRGDVELLGLWFCVVAIADHDGDLDALAEAIENQARTFGGGTVESKLSHLDDLKRRMADTGLDARARGRRGDRAAHSNQGAREGAQAGAATPRHDRADVAHTAAAAVRAGAARPLAAVPRSHQSRITSGCRTGSARGSDPRARPSCLRGGWKPRSSGWIARPPKARLNGSPPGVRSLPGATGRWSAAMTPTA